MKVESSVIDEIEYFEDEKVLEIVFLESKSRYAYYDFPTKEFNDFAEAESKGRFYNERIKRLYASFKISQ